MFVQVAEVNTAFPGWCHTTAAKANPLLGLFHLVRFTVPAESHRCTYLVVCTHPLACSFRDEGLGAEAASLGELTQALYAGFAPEKIMFDSPTKTPQASTLSFFELLYFLPPHVMFAVSVKHINCTHTPTHTHPRLCGRSWISL